MCGVRWPTGACGTWFVIVVFGQAGVAHAQAAESGGEPPQTWLVRTAIGLVILGLSVYMVTLVAWMFSTYRRKVAIPSGLVRELESRLERRGYGQAYEILAADASPLGRVLLAGVRRLPAGLPAAQRAMELANEQVVMQMEHRTSYLATVATLGPMLGLLGTVYGMIISFGVIARSSASPDASDLAAGISTALVATLQGIAVAVPAIAFYALFRNRIARLSLEIQVAAENLLEQFLPGLRAPHPLAAAATARSAASARDRPALAYRDENLAEDL